MRVRTLLRALAVPALALAAYLALASAPGLWEGVLRALYPGESRVLFQDPMLHLVGVHAAMVALSSALSVVLGVGLGVFVTRPAGADFYDVVSDFSSLAQTFPPIAVFTLAVPLLGFGFEPTVLALTAYGVLPILANTVAGIRSLPEATLDSARGMGMSPLQVLLRVELPLALPVIIAGVRISVVVNVATATIGAVAGAGGLGAPIISGLVNDDPAVTLQGALLAAGLALIADAWLGAIGKAWAPGAAAGEAASA